MPILIKGSGGVQEKPVIEVSSGGLITATAGDEVETKQMNVLAAQTITPGRYNKTIAAGQYLTGDQVIEGAYDLHASNIKNGIEIFGVTGYFRGSIGLGNITSDMVGTVTIDGQQRWAITLPIEARYVIAFVMHGDDSAGKEARFIGVMDGTKTGELVGYLPGTVSTNFEYSGNHLYCTASAEAVPNNFTPNLLNPSFWPAYYLYLK